MCLNSVELNTRYNPRTKEFIGTGYKVYRSCETPKKRVWLEATGNWGDNFSTRCIKSLDDDNYWPGFHIFLRPEDAQKYRSYGTVYEVKFKGITAFGTNKHSLYLYGPCVITQYMKIEKKHDFKQE